MTTASPARAHSSTQMAASAATKAPARRMRRPAPPAKEEFLQQLTPDLRKTVEALQKLYQKK